MRMGITWREKPRLKKMAGDVSIDDGGIWINMYDSDHVVPPPQLETEYLTRIVINDNDFV